MQEDVRIENHETVDWKHTHLNELGGLRAIAVTVDGTIIDDRLEYRAEGDRDSVCVESLNFRNLPQYVIVSVNGGVGSFSFGITDLTCDDGDCPDRSLPDARTPASWIHDDHLVKGTIIVDGHVSFVLFIFGLAGFAVCLTVSLLLAMTDSLIRLAWRSR